MTAYRHMDPIWILDMAENYFERIREFIEDERYAEAQAETEEITGILQQLDHQLWNKCKQESASG